MFFIGVFGVNQGQKPIGVYNNAICPSCGMLTRYEIFRTYSYLHVFFIPTIRWNNKYLVKSTCCGSVFELDPQIGREFEKGSSHEIRSENLRPLTKGAVYKYCSACNVQVEPGYRFCPYCGRQI